MKTDLENYDAMTFDQLVPTNSQYLTKDDVGESGRLLTIAAFDREMLEGDNGKEQKTIMFFREKDAKPMVLNKTNANLVPVLTGARTVGEAIGKQVVVYNDVTVSFGGRITGGLRLRSAGSGKSVKADDPEFDDAIPF